MKWIARLGEREETVEVLARSSTANVGEGLAPSRSAEAGSSERQVVVKVGDQVLGLDLATGRAQDPPLRRDARETSVIHAGRQHEVAIERLSRSRYAVSIDGHVHEVTVDDQLGILTREAAEARGGKGGTVSAYMPGKVVAVLVEEGAEVQSGDGVVVLEAMKMENEIQSDIDGVVSKVYVEAGQAVEGGDALFEVVVS